MNKIIKYGFGVIAVYLVVVYASGASSDAKAGGSAIGSIVSNLQGR